jgi:hypothetical protein
VAPTATAIMMCTILICMTLTFTKYKKIDYKINYL